MERGGSSNLHIITHGNKTILAALALVEVTALLSGKLWLFDKTGGHSASQQAVGHAIGLHTIGTVSHSILGGLFNAPTQLAHIDAQHPFNVANDGMICDVDGRLLHATPSNWKAWLLLLNFL
jgi:hypothetical protein